MSESCVRGISRSIKTLQRRARTPAMSGIIGFAVIVFAFMTYSAYAADDDPASITDYPAWDTDQNNVVDVSDLLFVAQHLDVSCWVTTQSTNHNFHCVKALVLQRWLEVKPCHSWT